MRGKASGLRLLVRVSELPARWVWVPQEAPSPGAPPWACIEERRQHCAGGCVRRKDQQVEWDAHACHRVLLAGRGQFISTD